MTIRPRRSVLYMPASNARALEKARGIPADVLILDLEDAVAPDAKETARGQACAAVASGGYGGREMAIRINGLGTPWIEADIAAVAKAAPDAVVLHPILLGFGCRHLADCQRGHLVQSTGLSPLLWQTPQGEKPYYRGRITRLVYGFAE